MILTPVTSSNIKALGWEDEVLTVEFATGKTYEYQNVGKPMFDTLVGAESVGKTFIALIKSHPVQHPFAIKG